MINRSNNCLKVICFRFTPIYISKEKINQNFLSALLFLFLTPKNRRQQGKQKTERLTRNSKDSVLQPFCHCNRQLLSFFDQLGKLQPKMIVYQGPIYMEQQTLSDQTLLCREPTKFGQIFSK